MAVTDENVTLHNRSSAWSSTFQDEQISVPLKIRRMKSPFRHGQGIWSTICHGLFVSPSPGPRDCQWGSRPFWTVPQSLKVVVISNRTRCWERGHWLVGLLVNDTFEGGNPDHALHGKDVSLSLSCSMPASPPGPM